MPLNINFQQILLHLINFVVLFGILYFLLYKPVKDFMDKRTQYYKDIEVETQENLAKSESAKAEYINKLESAEDEITEMKAKAHKDAEKASVEKIKEAEKEAAKILSGARKNIERERSKMIKEAQTEIADMVTTATEKLVINSSTSDAYDHFLDAAKRGENS